MVKKQSLKAKLKAADRRRKRRPSSIGASNSRVIPTSTATPSGQPLAATKDPMDLIAKAIMDHANDQSSSLKDELVTATLRGLLRGSNPKTEEAEALRDRLEKIPEREDISRRAYRNGIETILKIAQQHENQTVPDAFLQYLSILCS